MEFKKWLYLERNSSGLFQLLNRSYKFLIFLYSNSSLNIKENDNFQPVPLELLSNSCGKWCSWIKRFSPNFESNPNQKVQCGSEGCALFAGNKIVIKFTKGKEEATIATLIKGNPNFPVVDTTYYEGVYGIAMKELERLSFASPIRYSHQIILTFLKTIMETNDSHENLYESFVSWYKSSGKQEDENTLQFCYKLIHLMQIIKDKTGYLLGDDWGYYNLGKDNQNQIQPFDFGYPKMKGELSPKTTEIPSLEE